MAGNEKSGKKKSMPLTAEQIIKSLWDYVDVCEEKDRAEGLADFCDFLNRRYAVTLTQKKVVEFRKAFYGGELDTYKAEAEAWEVVVNHLRGEWESGSRWRGTNAGKAMLLLSQDLGDGYKYYKSGSDIGQSGVSGIKIAFGGNDARDYSSGD